MRCTRSSSAGPRPRCPSARAAGDALRHQTLRLADLAASAKAVTGEFSRELESQLPEMTAADPAALVRLVKRSDRARAAVRARAGGDDRRGRRAAAEAGERAGRCGARRADRPAQPARDRRLSGGRLPPRGDRGARDLRHRPVQEFQRPVWSCGRRSRAEDGGRCADGAAATAISSGAGAARNS